MQSFVFSALLSFVVYEALAFIDIPPRKGWFSLGTINVNFDPMSAKWAQRGLMGVIVLAILLSTLWVHQYIYPFDSISRNKTNIILGFLFGPLFAIWLNSVFTHPPGAPLGRGKIIGGIALILFCVIGSAGNQTGKLIEQLARKVSGVKGLGLEISLSESQRKKDASQAATSLADSKHPTSFGSSSGSAGLGYVSQLDEIIQRDEDYLADVFGQKTDQLLLAELNRAQALAKLAVTPPMKCLAGWLEATADASYVSDRLVPLVAAFRQISTANGDQRRLEVSRTFVREIARVGADVEGFGAPNGVEQACTPLFLLFCSSFINADTLAITDHAGLMSCLRSQSERTDNELLRPSNEFATRLADDLRSFVADNGLETRPYFAIAHASLLAQLSQYPAAAAVLDGWLDRQRVRAGDNMNIVEHWFGVRIRSMMAAYVEEWLVKQGDSAATVLRNEHLQNLDVLRTALRAQLAKSKFLVDKQPRRGQKTITLEPGVCLSTEAEPRLSRLKALFSSYVSMELTHIQNRLHHPDYKAKFVESTDADITSLLNLDLSCLSGYPAPRVVYAQILDSYALNMIQFVKARNDTESTDDKDTRLESARQALAFGLEITNDPASRDLNRTGVPFLKRIAPSDWVSTRESLQQTTRELANLTEE